MRSVHYKISREPTDQVQVAIEFAERLMPSKHNELDRDPDQQSVLSARLSFADTPVWLWTWPCSTTWRRHK